MARDIDTQSSDNPKHYQGLVVRAMERFQWFMGRSTDRPSVPDRWIHLGEIPPHSCFEAPRRP